MAFCNKCGAQIPDGANVCPNCGTSQSQQTQPPNVYVSPNPNPNYAQYQGNDHTAEFDPQDVADNKVMAVLAYIGFLFLIPLLAAPQSKFARFHTNQGLVLFIVDVICGVIMGILGAILSLVPVLGVLATIVDSILGLLIFILMLIGIINAAQGKAKELPVIGRITILK